MTVSNYVAYSLIENGAQLSEKGKEGLINQLKNLKPKELHLFHDWKMQLQFCVSLFDLGIELNHYSDLFDLDSVTFDPDDLPSIDEIEDLEDKKYVRIARNFLEHFLFRHIEKGTLAQKTLENFKKFGIDFDREFNGASLRELVKRTGLLLEN